MDYKQKLLQILYCIEKNDGCLFEGYWKKFGMTVEETKEIEEEYDKVYKKLQEKNEERKKNALILFKKRVTQIQKYCRDTFGEDYYNENLNITQNSIGKYGSDYMPHEDNEDDDNDYNF